MVESDASGRILDLEAKPVKPRSSIAVSGLYFCDNGRVEIAFRLKPCPRWELEITDADAA